MKKSLSIILASLALNQNVSAINLTQALEYAYKNNSDFKSSQEDYRIVIEQFPQALSRFMPDISADFKYGRKITKQTGIRGIDRLEARSYNKSLNVTQNLFRGGTDYAGLKAAKSQFMAAKYKFVASEQDTMLKAVQQFLEYYVAKEIYRIYLENTAFYQTLAESARQKFKLGQATRTELAQAQTEYARSNSEKAKAYANSLAIRMKFRQFLGIDPVVIEIPKIPQNLPKTIEEFRQISLKSNPTILATRASADAANSAIHAARAGLAPSVDLISKTSFGDTIKSPSSAKTKLNEFETAVQLRIPIIPKGGAEVSRVREARNKARKSAIALTEAMRSTETDIESSWELFIANGKSLKSSEEAIKTASLALKGTKHEEAAGTKSILDVLKAKKDLSDTDINKVKSLKEYLVSAYKMHAVWGQLTAKMLKLNGKQFDPEDEFKKIQFKLIGF